MKKSSNFILWLTFILAISMIIIGVYSSTLHRTLSKGQEIKISQLSCSALPRKLKQLLVVPNPATFAAQSGVFFDNGRVRVDIELTANEDDLADKYGFYVEARAEIGTEKLLQALVPLTTLCELSNDPRVRTINTPVSYTLD